VRGRQDHPLWESLHHQPGSHVKPARCSPRQSLANAAQEAVQPAYRAQGRKVDTAHAMITNGTIREVLYVAATRGTEINQLYVDAHYDSYVSIAVEGTTEVKTAHQGTSSPTFRMECCQWPLRLANSRTPKTVVTRISCSHDSPNSSIL